MKITSLLMMLFALAIFAIGCDESKPTDKDKDKDDHGHEQGHDEHDHGAGKHGGHIIDIGREHAYHAEFVADHENEMVTIYMMDGEMNPLALSEPSISVVATADGNTQTFELNSKDPSGGSEYSSKDANLMKVLDGHFALIKIRVNIDGKPFTGSYDYHNDDHDDHEGHDHD